MYGSAVLVGVEDGWRREGHRLGVSDGDGAGRTLTGERQTEEGKNKRASDPLRLRRVSLEVCPGDVQSFHFGPRLS